MSELQPRLEELGQTDQKLGLLHGVVSIDDEVDFADLCALDNGWDSLRNGATPDLEEMDMEAAVAKYSARLDDPSAPKHMLGYLYYASLNHKEGWVSISSTFARWLGGKGNKQLPRSVSVKVLENYDSLIEEGLVEKGNLSYRLHPDYEPSHDFPDYSDNFEEVITPMLRQRPLGAWAVFILQTYFKESGYQLADVTPYEYWAGRYTIKKLHDAGKLESSRGARHIYRLSAEPEPELAEEEKLVQDSLDEVISLRTKGLVIGPEDTGDDFEKKLRIANISQRTKLRKPQQRGRW